MLYDLLYEERQDKFENFTFSGRTWSAPSLEAPEKIRELLDRFHLVGRKIKKIKLIGLNYSLTRDRINITSHFNHCLVLTFSDYSAALKL